MSRIVNWYKDTDGSASTAYTFDYKRVVDFNEISVVVDTNKDGKITLEHSVDASNFSFPVERYVYANKVEHMKFPVFAEYARLKYENVEATDASVTMAAYGHENGAANIFVADFHRVLLDDLNLAQDETTSSVNLQHHKDADIYGNVNPGPRVLKVQYSHNDSDFYDTMHSISASGDFHAQFQVNSRYLRLKNTETDTSATIVISMQ